MNNIKKLLPILLILATCFAENTAISAEPVIGKEKKMDDESPRRMEPKKVPPLVWHGVRYEVVLRAHLRGFKQSGGVIAAIDEKTGKEKWIAQVYQTHYDSDEEKDVQNVYVTRLEAGAKGIIVTNERGERYIVDLDGKNFSKID